MRRFDRKFFSLFNSIKVYLFLTLLNSDRLDSTFFMISLGKYDLILLWSFIELRYVSLFLMTVSIDVSIYILRHIYIKTNIERGEEYNFLLMYFVVNISIRLPDYFILLHYTYYFSHVSSPLSVRCDLVCIHTKLWINHHSVWSKNI